MKLTLSTMGRFRLGALAGQAQGSRQTLKMLGRICKKVKLSPDEAKDLGDGRFLVNQNMPPVTIDFEESEVDWMEGLFNSSFEGFTMADMDDEHGWVPKVERQIAQSRGDTNESNESISKET